MSADMSKATATQGDYARMEPKIKAMRKEAKPSREAQAIRASIFHELDEDNEFTDLACDLMDIAAERGLTAERVEPPLDHLGQPRSEWAAENTRRDQEAERHAETLLAVEAYVERAKQAASDHEAAKEILRQYCAAFGHEAPENEQTFTSLVAGALAERGRAEREQWMACARVDALMNGPRLKGWNVAYLNRLWEKCTAAIRNQTGD